MKKTLKMMMMLVMCVVMSIPAYAVDTGTNRLEQVSSENMVFMPSGEEDNGIEPMAGPGNISTARIFRVEKFTIYPLALKNGTYEPVGSGLTFTPPSNNLNLTYKVTLAKQQELIDSATSQGYEVVGWYLSGTFYMECYMPKRVDYRVYNHESNGNKLMGTPVRCYTNKYQGTATISTAALFPKDMSKAYTYGFDGYGVMTVYSATGSYGGQEEREFTLKATFEV